MIDRLTDAQLLALTGLGEARGEPLEGVIAVLQVVGHRVRDRRWPDTWRGVILQPRQFSTWNAGDPNRALLERLAARLVDEGPLGVHGPAYREALWAAEGVLRGAVRDLVKGSTHYHTTSVRPAWSRHQTPATKIGHHVFFNTVS